MGSDVTWRGLNAPHRLDLGWIPEGSVLNVSRECVSNESFTTTLSSLSLTGSPEFLGGSSGIDAESYLAQHTFAVRVSRLQPGGGVYLISLRTAVGYDDGMRDGFVDRVSVHYVSPVRTLTLPRVESHVTSGFLDRCVFDHGY
jgi:hypothetical protein